MDIHELCKCSVLQIYKRLALNKYTNFTVQTSAQTENRGLISAPPLPIDTTPTPPSLALKDMPNPSARHQMQARTRPSKHLLELSMAEAEVMTTGRGGYLCLSLHITSIPGKRLYRFGRRQRKALSAPTQRNTLRDQNPKGQLWLRATLCHGVFPVCAALKPTDRCENV